MRNLILTIGFVLVVSVPSHAQWVVYDPAVTYRNSVTAVLKEPAQVSDAESIHPALAGADLVEVSEDSVSGIRIRAVAPGSPAAQSGLRVADRIIGVNRQRVASLSELRAAAKDQATLLLQLRRGNQAILIPLR